MIFFSVNPFAEHKVCGDLGMNTWQPGSDVDLRPNDKTGSPLVKNRTRSSVPELKDCGKAEPGQKQHDVRLVR